MSALGPVVHVSPASFGAAGLYGGGERYPLELAKAMSSLTRTRLVTFGEEPSHFYEGDLEVVVLRRVARWRGSDLNPLARGLLKQLRDAQVLHTHHFETMLTSLALVVGRTSSTSVFCTDHGGKAPNVTRKLHLQTSLDGFLPVSEFSASVFPELAPMFGAIYGGVDTTKYRPGPSSRNSNVVFVGRLLPHKGLDVLLEALPDGARLDIFGRGYDDGYLRVLQNLARDKQVAFHIGADDLQVVQALQSARVAVLPSVYRTPYGPDAPRSELLGLALLEAMACGTPVIATNVGGMPEIVREGRNGFIVEPNDVTALSSALQTVLALDEGAWASMSRDAVDSVDRSYTWTATARRCLSAYAAVGALEFST